MLNMSILESIDSPSRLKLLKNGQLNALAEEIRREILRYVSDKGGHLASNLGITELTIAIHKVFDSPIDRIIFDVGHQCYPHKMLTGRLKMFEHLRQANGLSGYPHPDESPHDHYHTGHASTALSLATGEILARKLKGEDRHIITIVGDGSLTGGESFEALNHLGSLGEDAIVIFNDNQMSISPSVGALSLLTNKFRASLTYRSISHSLGNSLSKMGGFGEWLVGIGMRIKTALKNILLKNQYFEKLGFKYFGPIDGHNISLMVAFLKRMKKMKGPVLLHVLTTKGKGYKYAEQGPTKFHGIPPFETTNGNTKKTTSTQTYSMAFGHSVLELMKRDEKIVVISSAMLSGTGLSQVQKVFPERVLDVGIAEPHSVTMASALAKTGMKPIVALYSTFLQRAFDQIIHDVSLMNQPVVFAIDRAGVVPADGPTHQGVFDLAYMSMVPGMTVMSPASADELDQMLKLAVSMNSPSAIRYPKDMALIDDNAEPVLMGKASVERVGDRVLIAYVGAMKEQVVMACETLSREGISCGVVNLRFAKPIDWKTIEQSAKGKGLIVTVEDGIIDGGIGQRIKSHLSGVKVVNLGVADEIPPIGTRMELLEQYGLDAIGISKTVRDNT